MAQASLKTASHPSTRAETEDAFLDAAERLLIGVGYSGITTRRLAEEAGANHGLVHYYLGSMENLFVRVLERFTKRLVAPQREMHRPAVRFARRTAKGDTPRLPVADTTE